MDQTPDIGSHRPPAAKSSTGDPFTPRQLRALKIAVVVMGIILIAGFAAVIGRIAYLVAKGGAIRPVGTGVVETARLALPPGAIVRSIALDGDRLAVHYDLAKGAGIAILDLATGKSAAHVDLTSQ